MAKRLSKPVTGLGALVNFWRKASLRLCAGSVEMMSTFLRAAASCTARLREASILRGFSCPRRICNMSLTKQFMLLLLLYIWVQAT